MIWPVVRGRHYVLDWHRLVDAFHHGQDLAEGPVAGNTLSEREVEDRVSCMLAGDCHDCDSMR